MNLELAAKFIQPEMVLDIGANIGNWSKEAIKVWPNAHYLLIEGNSECQPMLQETGFSYLIAVLSDRQKEVDFYTLKDCETATGASYYREQTEFFTDDRIKVNKVQTVTLDDVIPNLKGNILIKLDCQGSELDIMKGGKNVMSQVDSVIVEVSHAEYNQGAPTDNDIFCYMDTSGFNEIAKVGTSVHPITRLHIQSDILFKRR